MNQIDVYYRALLDYRAQTTANRDCEKLNKGLAKINDENVDSIKVTRAECIIDEEWVRKIEEGLIHVEKAIKEERQFIRSNGEVVPIEKVRNFSRESVEHLAKHSNLLTRKPEDGKDIIPDQLYTVERLNDYTVYENRFLYMLLCYLRDIITLRYNKILDITGKYEGELKIDKVVTVGKQKITYSVYMHDERRDDAYLHEHNSAKHTIDRISLILKSVLAFLATPLMEYCEKVPMLKPPITKTNVLKMNNNFKGAVALYDYIITYDKPGYSVEYVVNELSPYRDEISSEMAEAGAMLSFLTYEHGLGIESDLRIAYDEEELLRRAIEIRKRQEEIEMMMLRVQKTGQGLEDYALALEKQVKLLLRDNERIAPLEQEIEDLKAVELALRDQVSTLEIYLAETKAAMLAQEQEFLVRIAQMEEDFAHEMAELISEHEEEIATVKEEHNAEIDRIHTAYLSEIQKIKNEHVEEIQQLISDYTAEIERLLEDHKAELKTINDEHYALVENLTEKHRTERESLLETNRINTENYNHKIHELNAEHSRKLNELEGKLASVENELNDTRNQYDDVSAEKLLTEARLKATRAANGLMSDEDFTDRVRFNELEREYTAFMKFYDEQWRKTKKKIRKEALKDVSKKEKKVRGKGIDNTDTFEEIKDEVAEEIRDEVAEEIKDEVAEEIRDEVAEEIVKEIEEEIKEEIAEETTNQLEADSAEEQKGQDE